MLNFLFGMFLGFSFFGDDDNGEGYQEYDECDEYED